MGSQVKQLFEVALTAPEAHGTAASEPERGAQSIVPVAPQISAPPQRRVLGAFVIAAALVCLLALAVLVLLKFVVRRQVAPAQQLVKLTRLPVNGRAVAAIISPDGRAIYYLDGRAGISNIWAQPVDGSASRQVTNFKTGSVIAYDWSRTGTLACARGIETTGVVLIRDFK